MTRARGIYRNLPKRVFDLALAIPATVVLSPLMASTAVVVAWDLGTPVLFKQPRPGKNGRVFTLFKFRTMRNSADGNGRLLPDSERLTRFGKFLRSTSIDELPELWNVIRGDMSLVGPRPLLVEYLERYSPEQARRHEVRPGVTGWAQVQGRNAIRFAERFKCDVWYVDNVSFLLDLKILAMTCWKMLIREGIDQPGKMEVFKGIKEDLPDE